MTAAAVISIPQFNRSNLVLPSKHKKLTIPLFQLNTLSSAISCQSDVTAVSRFTMAFSAGSSDSLKKNAMKSSIILTPALMFARGNTLSETLDSLGVGMDWLMRK